MTEQLLEWYRKNQRDLPWRKTLHPYKIWVSEIILQQTQIKTGIKYYHKFLDKFPDLKSLSTASDLDVLKIWEGLGYYNRALNMLLTAKAIMLQHNGIFPKKYVDLIKLKGIGTYTASAISSICGNEQRGVVDGNVYRVLSRFYNIKTPINTVRGKKEFQKIANNLVPAQNPGTYNQAIMDFGSTHCTKYNPKCKTCPFKIKCISFGIKEVTNRPVKNKKIYFKIRHFNYLFLKLENQFIIQQRKKNDIWKQLYELPLIESDILMDKKTLTKHTYFQGYKIISIKYKYQITHTLSHQKLKILFWEIHAKKIKNKPGFRKIYLTDVLKYPFPKPLQDYFYKEHLSS